MSVIGICACCSARSMGSYEKKLPLDSSMMISPPLPPPPPVLPDSAAARNAPNAELSASQTLQTDCHTSRSAHALADTSAEVKQLHCRINLHVLIIWHRQAIVLQQSRIWSGRMHQQITEPKAFKPAYLMHMLGRLPGLRGASSVALRSATVANVATVWKPAWPPSSGTCCSKQGCRTVYTLGWHGHTQV